MAELGNPLTSSQPGTFHGSSPLEMGEAPVSAGEGSCRGGSLQPGAMGGDQGGNHLPESQRHQTPVYLPWTVVPHPPQP